MNKVVFKISKGELVFYGIMIILALLLCARLEQLNPVANNNPEIIASR